MNLLMFIVETAGKVVVNSEEKAVELRCELDGEVMAARWRARVTTNNYIQGLVCHLAEINKPLESLLLGHQGRQVMPSCFCYRMASSHQQPSPV